MVDPRKYYVISMEVYAGTQPQVEIIKEVTDLDIG